MDPLENCTEETEFEEQLRDRLFNPWRIPKTNKAKAVTLDVIQQLQAYEEYHHLRQRRRRRADQERFEAAVSAIVSNLVYHHVMGHGEGVRITRSNRYLGSRSRYSPLVFTKSLPTILDCLKAPEMAFVVMVLGHKGIFGRAKETTIWAGPRLIRRVVEHDLQPEDFGLDHTQEVIQLKRIKQGGWDDGGLEEYEDTPETIAYREQLRAINAWLEAAEIEFDECYWPDGRPVDTLDRRLRRVFTQGRFDSGGRLYGGFWQHLKKETRLKGLSINREEVVELDYGQMNPRILYGLCGAQPLDCDAYDIPGYQRFRPGVKKVMNSMIFATKRLTRMPKGVRKEFEEQHRVEQVMQAIEDAHPAIKDSFFKGMGHEAQFIESQVMVEVLLTLRELEIHALPIHDSVLVAKSNKDKVKEIMLSCFLKVVGVQGLVDEVVG